MGFVKVASTKTLGAGPMMGTEVDDKSLLVANVGGKFYAIGNDCTHRGCRLSGGKLKENGIVECPRHGSNFDVRTGNVVKGPAMNPEPVLEVKLDNEQIMINV